MLIETHAHLNDKAFDADRPAVLEKVFQAGVGKIVEIACAPGEWAQGEQLAAAYPGRVACAFGAHPEYTRTLTPALMSELDFFMDKPCAVALGEVGLDYWWDIGTKEEQLALPKSSAACSTVFPAAGRTPAPAWTWASRWG